MNNIDFYGFRGNITFFSRTLFNESIYNSHEEKNKLFRKIFNTLKDERLTSDYSKRVYQLIYIDEKDDIVYCKLARKRKTLKYKYGKLNDINAIFDEDFPFVNVLVDLKSQKFLIQKNSSVFDNFQTCVNVLKKIISRYLEEKSAEINFYPITKEKDFYYYIDNNYKIYSVNFVLNSPNAFGGTSAAEELAKSVKDFSGCEIFELEMRNSKGTMNFDDIVVESFLKYISGGGGSWRLTYKDSSDKRRQNVSSKSIGESIKINSNVDKNINLKDKLVYNNIIDSFNSLEKFDSLKRNDIDEK